MKRNRIPWKIDDGSAFQYHITASDGSFICSIKHSGQLSSKGIAKEITNCIIESVNNHGTLKAKSDLFDELVQTCRECFAQGGKVVPMMTIIDSYSNKAKELSR